MKIKFLFFSLLLFLFVGCALNGSEDGYYQETFTDGRIVRLNEPIELARGEKIALEGTFLSLELDFVSEAGFADGTRVDIVQITKFEDLDGQGRGTMTLSNEAEKRSHIIGTLVNGDIQISLLNIDKANQQVTVLLESLD